MDPLEGLIGEVLVTKDELKFWLNAVQPESVGNCHMITGRLTNQLWLWNSQSSSNKGVECW